MTKHYFRAMSAARVLACMLMLALLVGSLGPAVSAQEAPAAPPADTADVGEPATDPSEPTEPSDAGEPAELPGGVEFKIAPLTDEGSGAESSESSEEELPAGAERISEEDLAILDGEEEGPALRSFAFFGGDPQLVIEKELVQDSGRTGMESYDDFSVTIQKYKRFLIIFWVPDGAPEVHTFDDVTGLIELEADRAHRYVITENSAPDYTTTYSDEDDECDFTYPLLGSPTKTCTITNDDIAPPIQQCTLVSDESDTYIGNTAATEIEPHPVWSTAFSGDGAEWIWAAADSSDATVTFTRKVNVSGVAGDATLEVAADNSYSVKLNGTPVSCLDGSGDNNFNSTNGPSGGPDSCDVTLPNGENTLEFTVTNAGGSANPAAGNPAGLYYRVTFDAVSCTEVPPPPPVQYAEVTMCKTDTEQNPLGGWTLMLLGEEYDSINVGSDGADYSLFGVPAGDYVLRANGFYTYRGTTGAEYSDAAYSKRDPGDGVYGGAFAPWSRVNDFPSPYTGWLGVMLNDGFTNWGSVFNSGHSYALGMNTGSTMDFTFNIYDDQYGDNSGSINVAVDEGFSGVTDEESGCVTFDDVPYGDYTANEVLQDGWTNESGIGLVTVNDPEETFYIVNEEEVETPNQCVIGSDATTLEGGSPSFIAGFIHSSWTMLISGVSWIWGDAAIVDPVGTETQVFTKTFWLDSAPGTDATLEIAADNSYSVTLNGNPVGADASEDNYSSVDTIIIPSAEFDAGANTLVITVNNFAMAGGTAQTNPAGLRYKLTIDESSCSETPPAQEFLKVHIYKYLKDGESEAQVANDSGETPFPMVASWNAANLGGAGGPAGYVLGNGHGGAAYTYAADTSPMSAPADYTTSEVTDGSVVLPIGGTCVADKYRLVGYREGNTLIEAQNDDLSPTAPVYTGLTSDKYVIVVNEDCDDVLDEEPVDPDTELIIVTDDTSPGENVLGWMFGRDTSTETPFSFDSGNQSIGSGSLFVPAITNLVDGNSDKFIGELFLQKLISDINSISYDFNIAGPDANAEEHFYMSVYANFGVSSPTKFYDCRYSVVPTTGSVGSYTTVTFDPTQVYPVTQSGSSPAACPASPAAMGAGATIRAISLNVGDTSGSDTGVSGYLDRVVVSTPTMITTYDFEPAATVPADPPQNNNGGGGGGGGGGGSNNDDDGEVLGASTDGEVLGNECALLTDFMREGMANDPAQVTLLQAFLNGEMSSGLPESGFFGSLTTSAVNSFQLKYWEEVLKPWAEIGMGQEKTPTGFVYKTTLWKINNIKCPDLNAPFPTLP